jgi:hypothetical protein
MSEHTPGPWHVKDFDGDQIMVRGERSMPAVCTGPDRWANARLIAAAPELLEAAKLALDIAEEWISSELSGTGFYEEDMAELQPVRDAIAKAEGKDDR